MFFQKLKDSGILGMNQRIGEFILPLNSRKLYPLVDDKSLTYEVSRKFNIPMPKTYFEIKEYGGIKDTEKKLKDIPNFVIKPSRGGMGNGILVINDTYKMGSEVYYKRGNNVKLRTQELHHHISGILSGLYSLNGNPDKVIFQEKLNLHSIFHGFVDSGIPDLRIILFKGIPVLSMLRFPTKDSGGRANLHQGAVGVGLDMLTGRANFLVHRNKMVQNYSEFTKDIKSFQIPGWNEILQLASKTYDMVKMGYLGVDIVLDPDRGPILLELNARPGLAIQLANRIGLGKILTSMQKDELEIDSYLDRVEYCFEYWKNYKTVI
ncbi:MAG: alpha-L-glutamate ligase-like protein [Leptospira sp.]|jgi:alpha-L-glutamate ligase-like protein|nr:alpha-L-glutamate ligase-like protein [Leptospira sp.]NCS92670.1 alpha-L-glutamate ligase-like protein [Leptospira sp.]